MNKFFKGTRPSGAPNEIKKLFLSYFLRTLIFMTIGLPPEKGPFRSKESFYCQVSIPEAFPLFGYKPP